MIQKVVIILQKKKGEYREYIKRAYGDNFYCRYIIKLENGFLHSEYNGYDLGPHSIYNKYDMGPNSIQRFNPNKLKALLESGEEYRICNGYLIEDVELKL